MLKLSLNVEVVAVEVLCSALPIRCKRRSAAPTTTEILPIGSSKIRRTKQKGKYFKATNTIVTPEEQKNKLKKRFFSAAVTFKQA
jgi:hypothetical protein